MPPKNFKSFKPDEFKPDASKLFIPQGGHNSGVGSGYQSPRGYSNTNTPSRNGGITTPVLSTTTSSSTSLASLSSALTDMELSPVSDYFAAIKQAKSLAEVRSAAALICEALSADGIATIETYNIHDRLKALVKSKTSPVTREGALVVLSAISRQFASDHTIQAYLLPSLTLPLDLLADKDNSVKRAAQTTIDTLVNTYGDEAKVSALLSVVLAYLDSSAKWQSKIGGLKIFEKIFTSVPQDYLESTFVKAIPVLTNIMHDMKPELSTAGTKTLTEYASKLDNQDIVPRIPIIVKTLSDPKNVQECLKTLSHVTFVTEVTESALSVLVPILNRALNLSSTSQDSLRQTVIVVENLTRLVHNPLEVKGFIPQLEPGVKKVVNTAAQPEVRELAAKALKVLEDAENEDISKTRITFEEAYQKLSAAAEVTPTVLSFVADLVTVAVNTREFTKLGKIYTDYGVFSEEKAQEQVKFYRAQFADSAVADSSEEGIEIVNSEFSLAYGGRMLLNKTVLRLFKGRRYGLCGRNGAGKSTLMRSIADGKLEGFPDKSELRCCFVEHKLQGSETDLDLVSFIASDPELAHVAKEDIANALAEVGFNEERRAQNVGALSGGWKMKLELARAMLMKADILLLDEPTNHLDVSNVKWLQDYLIENTEITSLIVTHDSGFLDAVCTDIIHYESKKLVYYKGNLAAFVKVRPEGKSYYTLTDSNVKMAFPPPGILTGVRSNTRAIARMSHVTFGYPGAAKPSLTDASCALTLSSRVAILGPNGAGKSTLIKLLTGELMPLSGTVEKHPNLRIGYIAQHALQHVELHKEKTANQYLQWRYANGDDREVHLKQTRKMSDEEKEVMSKPIDVGDGRGARKVEAIIGRSKLKKTFQYEIKWVGSLPKFNSFLTREDLIERGFSKLVQAFDDHEASREGLGYRNLSPPVIRQHFEDVGLDGDIADHTPLGSLSGGQLVKVVIAGAMWNNPHLLVLDEPTNYLDRDSLGGLAVAIRDWTGGVIMISHNEEFVGALCPEQWIINDGKMVTKGKVTIASDRFEDSSSAPSTAANSAANSDVDTESPLNIKIRQKKKKMTRNELKEREVRRRKRYLEWLNTPKGTPRTPDTDDEDN